MTIKVRNKAQPGIDAGRRRSLRLTGAIAVTAVLPLTALRALAGSRASKESVEYKDSPKDGKKCSDCSQFQPPKKSGESGRCLVVAGDISAEGYCIAFAAK